MTVIGQRAVDEAAALITRTQEQDQLRIARTVHTQQAMKS